MEICREVKVKIVGYTILGQQSIVGLAGIGKGQRLMFRTKKLKEEKLANNTKREMNENSFLFEEESSQVVSKRFASCCKWYIRCANRYKKIYLVMTLICGGCPILITALTGMDFAICYPHLGKGLVIGLSVMASLSVLVLNVSRALDKWTTYRIGSEYLKRERSFYLLEKEHRRRDIQELDQEFLQKIEEYMAQENAAWARANKNSVKAAEFSGQERSNSEREA